MPDLTIPQEAVDSSTVALTAVEFEIDRIEQIACVALAAAAPHIAAAALRQAADAYLEQVKAAGSDHSEHIIGLLFSSWLRHRADELDGRQPTPDTREGILTAVGLTEEDMQQNKTGGQVVPCYMGHDSTGPDGCQGACGG